MSKWLQSGRRRDICYLLAAHDSLRGQQLKSKLERRYDERIEPKSFYGTLSALVDAGFLETRTEGLADFYSLTEAGRDRLEDHYGWVQSCLE